MEGVLRRSVLGIPPMVLPLGETYETEGFGRAFDDAVLEALVYETPLHR